MRRGVFSALALSAALGHASLVPRMTIDEMAGASECVVEATVLSAQPAWDASHQFIWTHYRLAVHDWFGTGTGGPVIVVSEPGGTIGGVTMRVAGATLYKQGERIVLFLRRTPVGYLRAAGNGQGKFTITPERRVRAKIRGIELVGKAREAHLDGMPLDQFKLKVRRAIERAGAAGR